MERRMFINTIIGVGAITVVSGGAYFALHEHLSSHNGAKRVLSFSNLEQAHQELTWIRKAMNTIDLTGEWNLLQHISHCSQSIEFSMIGFPQQKPAIFQKTVGKIVFSQFEEQGYMRHNRNEPIPEAPPLVSNGDIQQAFDRLEIMMDVFDKFENQLAPHFAYGELTKKQYEKAHAMHLADHFSIMTY